MNSPHWKANGGKDRLQRSKGERYRPVYANQSRPEIFQTISERFFRLELEVERTLQKRKPNKASGKNSPASGKLVSLNSRKCTVTTSIPCLT